MYLILKSKTEHEPNFDTEQYISISFVDGKIDVPNKFGCGKSEFRRQINVSNQFIWGHFGFVCNE